MENEKSSISLIKILLIILLVTVIGSIVFFAYTINRTINAAVSPIQNVNSSISTQVSKLLNPTPTIIPDPVTIIREVQSLARLETIQYTVEKVITAEINQGVFGPLFGDRLLFVARGYVIAGVDLSKIGTEDMRLEDGVLFVELPDAEIFVATLNNDDSFVYDRTTGILRKSDQDLETNARQVAESEIMKAALEDGILAQAQQNAEVYLERLFNTLGYQQVVFE
ncbi:MAG: DUF4230 domain-containing protein [Brevefilum sp.]|nr:DUF4230 domain-containing protein [Brevefilum sp.]MDT8380891.1 DUF4230 domain-containing protein [Brevefilum sp.]MDW7755523.1 DUF4230 domain-containing protein [Brevefilum sp.]